MLRNSLSIAAGIITGGILIFLVEKLGHTIYPHPADFDYTDKEALAELIQNAPIGALLFVILAWTVGSFGGGLVASLISNEAKMRKALIVGVVLMLLGIMNMMMIPHPLWFWALGLAVYLPMAYLGGKIGEHFK
ncbi:MAG: hypothetical protein COC01_03635 [Bacteroidetes bacterium]|nr:hypothetical protein [Bacteroidia bacterium]PCH68524.1 MAG: hypothetical protein COC01_03635 [Bacteroidota bacterium]